MASGKPLVAVDSLRLALRLDETQERFKCNLMDEVEDRTTDCAAFACHAL